MKMNVIKEIKTNLLFKKESAKGFTLIEVMVATSILALLAAIIFANVHIGRAKASEAKALQEMKQVKTALEFRRLDNDGGYSGGGGSSAYPDGSGPIFESGITEELVPYYISSLEIKSPINRCEGTPFGEVTYISNNGVAASSYGNVYGGEMEYRCGAGTGLDWQKGSNTKPDKFVIFYPTDSNVGVDNVLFHRTKSSNNRYDWAISSLGFGSTHNFAESFWKERECDFQGWMGSNVPHYAPDNDTVLLNMIINDPDSQPFRCISDKQ